MRKKDENSHEKLLDSAKQIAAASGPDSITIRAVAKKAGIATGTVYNYFSNKDDILLALTEEYWRNTLLEIKDAITAESFCEQLNEIYLFLSKRIHQSAGMLMSSLRNVEIIGRDRMQSMQHELAKTLIQHMDADNSIRQDIWSETFTKEQYANFIVMNMMLLLQMKSHDIQFFIQIVKQNLYYK